MDLARQLFWTPEYPPCCEDSELVALIALGRKFLIECCECAAVFLLDAHDTKLVRTQLRQRAIMRSGELPSVCIVCGCTNEAACPEGCWWRTDRAGRYIPVCTSCEPPKRLKAAPAPSANQLDLPGCD